MNEKVKNILERCLKTFIETAVAYLIPALAGVDFFGGDNVKTALMGLGISAAAAGLSAVYSGIIKPLIDNKTAGTVAAETPSDDYLTEDEGATETAANTDEKDESEVGK